MMRTSQPGWNEGAITLSASRIRRRTRFRTTAPPSRLPVASPNRVWSRSFRTNRPTSSGWVRDAPLRQPGEVARAGEHDEPQRVVTAVAGQAERCFRPLARRPRARADRPASSSGRGSRAPWRDGASWAEMSACPSGLSVILSIRPWDPELRPLEARKRAERPEARRRVFVVRGGYGAPGGVSNDGAGPVARARTVTRARPARRVAAGGPVIPPGSMRESPCDGPRGRCIVPEPSAPGRRGRPFRGGPAGAPSPQGVASARRASSRAVSAVGATHRSHSHQDPIAFMDAKQVWRAALGELQVSLSPANFETWLRDTYLVDVDDARFRIAVPNGFAKDWLDTRYRSLISQTLARVVGYSVQVEFVVQAARRGAGPGRDDRPQPVRVEPTRVGAPGRGRRAARPTSTPATRSRTSSSARPTGSPTPPPCRSPSGPATRTTRCSCTAAWASARPT